MRGTLLHTDPGSGQIAAIADPDAAAAAADIAASRPFWLDIATVDDEALRALTVTFGFHPLAVEDVEHFGQRAKVDRYDEFTELVAYGIDGAGTPVEVHCFYTDRFLVTVHREVVGAIDAARSRIQKSGDALPEPVMMLHRVIDALVDGFFPVLDGMDDAIDTLQDDILRKPSEAQLGRLFDLKRRLIAIRRVTTDQRDALADLLTGTRDLPGLDAESERYFRDVYDHLTRLAQTADGYRDLLSAALDTHLSTTSNRLNVVMKQLAIIATVFLPMSFLTGFFGQNFGWMVNRLGGSAVFWIAGVALQGVIAAALLYMFRRKGWLGADR